MNARAVILTGALGLAASAPTSAEEDPEFEHSDPEELEEVEDVQWDAKAQGSVVSTTGNSQTTTVSAGAEASRRSGSNKFRADGDVAYAKSSVLAADDADGSGAIDDRSEILRQEDVTSQAWALTARYDRFLSARDSLYGAGLVSADRPAGKAFAGGGQAGYSRALYSTDGHELTGEAGYDFSYESFVASGSSVAIHSGRFFLGYSGTFSEDTEGELSGEALTNLNPLTKPTGDVGVLGDTRLRGRLALTTEIFEGISFRGSFSARYQSAPSPLPPLDIPYADGFVPEAEALDTTTELSLIISLF